MLASFDATTPLTVLLRCFAIGRLLLFELPAEAEAGVRNPWRYQGRLFDKLSSGRFTNAPSQMVSLLGGTWTLEAMDGGSKEFRTNQVKAKNRQTVDGGR